MKDKVRIVTRGKISRLLVLLLFASYTDEVADSFITLHYTLKVYIVRVSLALPQNRRSQRLETTRENRTR